MMFRALALSAFALAVLAPAAHADTPPDLGGPKVWRGPNICGVGFMTDFAGHCHQIASLTHAKDADSTCPRHYRWSAKYRICRIVP